MNSIEEQNPALKVGLPKWPAMVVVGKPVTKEQAAEIIIRTDSIFGYFSCNDLPWIQQLAAEAGLPIPNQRHDSPDWQKVDELRSSLSHLDLEYLSNDRIASTWIGGPKGWCNWNGSIGCNNYNIGKWPSAETVFAEWTTIAITFPYLNLRAQLFSGETCEEGIVPVVEYRVSDGNVTAVIPSGPLNATESNLERDVFGVMNPHRERGCTIEQFRWALSLVRQKTSY